MAGIQISEAKAPWIMFERRAVEDRAQSIAQGRYVAKDEDFVLITPHGSKDQVERVVSDWLASNEKEVKAGRLDANWQRKYREAYTNWCEGKEAPLEGTPIINWPVVSPAQVKMLQDLRILTVEVLAQANEETIRRLGMGGRKLVSSAQEFLKQADKAKGSEETVALRQEIEALKQMNATQAEQIATLIQQVGAQQVPVGAPPAEPPSGIGAADLLDPPAALKKL
jgi:hypothetical protein